MPDLLIGAHTSISGGLYKALLIGQEIGATTVQIFTANQKRWESPDISQEAVYLWDKTRDETGIKFVMSHDSYLINLGCPDLEKLEKSRIAFKKEIERCHLLGINLLNFHPGNALEGSVQECLDTIVESLLNYEKLLSQGKTTLLLEATAGQGRSVGHTFEHLGEIVHRVKDRIPIGVCIDTCHIFAAGYDIRSKEDWEKVLQEFERHVGISYIKAFHVNDSMKGLGTRVDRHTALGEGCIGIECFKALMQNPKLTHIPKYLETPGGPELWVHEIARLKEFAK